MSIAYVLPLRSLPLPTASTAACSPSVRMRLMVTSGPPPSNTSPPAEKNATIASPESITGPPGMLGAIMVHDDPSVRNSLRSRSQSPRPIVAKKSPTRVFTSLTASLPSL